MLRKYTRRFGAGIACESFHSLVVFKGPLALPRFVGRPRFLLPLFALLEFVLVLTAIWWSITAPGSEWGNTLVVIRNFGGFQFPIFFFSESLEHPLSQPQGHHYFKMRF